MLVKFIVRNLRNIKRRNLSDLEMKHDSEHGAYPFKCDSCGILTQEPENYHGLNLCPKCFNDSNVLRRLDAENEAELGLTLDASTTKRKRKSIHVP